MVGGNDCACPPPWKDNPPLYSKCPESKHPNMIWSFFGRPFFNLGMLCNIFGTLWYTWVYTTYPLKVLMLYLNAPSGVFKYHTINRGGGGSPNNHFWSQEVGGEGGDKWSLDHVHASKGRGEEQQWSLDHSPFLALEEQDIASFYIFLTFFSINVRLHGP